MHQQNLHGEFENQNIFASDLSAPGNKPLQNEPELGSVLKQLGDVPNDRVLKPDALEHDIRLGWIPRSQVTGPIPLSYSQQNYDWVIESKKQYLIYLGFRPTTTFELHQRFYGEGKKYPFYQFHLCKAKFLQRFFKKYYSDYIFQGRQPQTIKSDKLTFDSYYEGGNLDAVYFEQGQYRLLLRVDSNTLGHCNYFNFKVKPSQTGRVIFRIMNITKWKSLYQKGMKPYVKKLKNDLIDFEQAGSSVRFTDSPLCQQFQIGRLKSMRFEYTFDEANVEYQFCYTIPYTYSQLYAQVKKQKNPYTHLSKLCHSLSGIQIPLLTISSPERQQNNDTFVIAIIGRVHPSEATGSHIINGVIKFLTSQNKEAKQLRNRVIFKIIPMLNPDGVIAGNTRTGFAGKDLNRQYRKNNEIVFPEVISTIDYVMKLKQKYGKRLLFFMDIHGHSTRKNSFFFGPEYPIVDEQYSRCRLLPRFYSTRTDIFRYYSCKYKVASYKEQTARGYFNTNGIKSYTHETSQHCFFDFSQRKDKAFTRDSLQNLGRDLSLSIYDFLRHMVGQDVPIPPLPDKNKKIFKAPSPGKKQEEVEEQEERSDDGSDKNDSEDETEDFQERKLMYFFNKINQNREYFYEELLAMQGGAQLLEKRPRQDRKRNKSDTIKSEQSRSEVTLNRNSINLNIEIQLLAKKQHKKIDWAAKAIYPEKKKSLQEYPRLSSVIFGSSIPDHYFTRRDQFLSSMSTQQGSPQHANERKTRYSVNCINAQFRSTKSKFPSPDHRVFRSTKGFKMNESQRCQYEDDPVRLKLISDPKTKERYIRLKEQILPGKSTQANFFTVAQVEEKKPLLVGAKSKNSLKPLPVFAVDLGKIAQEKKQEEKELMRMTNSLKVLTRKRSIKNFRQSESLQHKKVKKLKGASLSKKIPSLGYLKLKI